MKLQNVNHSKYLLRLQVTKVEVNYKRKVWKIFNIWKLNSVLLNTNGIEEEIKEKNKTVS